MDKVKVALRRILWTCANGEYQASTGESGLREWPGEWPGNRGIGYDRLIKLCILPGSYTHESVKDFSSSALAEHAWNCGSIDWNTTTVGWCTVTIHYGTIEQ